MYASAEQAFADADARLERNQELLARTKLRIEGTPAWKYCIGHRKLPADAVRGALDQLRYLEPPIPGRPPTDHALISLLLDQARAISGFQATFIDSEGRPTTTEPRRQTYALREHGVRDGLFHAGGGTGQRCYLTEGYLEKALAVASLGLGPVYGAGARTVLGYAIPPEPEVVIVADRRPVE